jgi:hypothetical protein
MAFLTPGAMIWAYALAGCKAERDARLPHLALLPVPDQLVLSCWREY